MLPLQWDLRGEGAMAKRDIIIIGGSMGSTGPIKTLLKALPADLPASVFVCTHLPVRGEVYLVPVLQKVSALPVVMVEDEMPVEAGKVYVAAADRHLLLIEGLIRLGSGPRENMVRPSIDPLMRSAALTYGPRVVGVIMSGMLNDGASGLWAVQQCGGLAVVQDPQDAEAPDMPLAAIEATTVDHFATAEALGPLLAELAKSTAGAGRPPMPQLRMEVEIAAGARLGSDRLREIADPVALTCPNCAGVLSEMKEGQPLRFRCQTGHAVTAQTMFETQHNGLEEALRVAMRVMEERTELVGRMGKDARRLGRSSVAELYEGRALEYGGYADILRKAVLSLMAPDPEDPTDPDDLPEPDE
jgi:two-component system chemotaxis response regulator CheB